jgi:hypothetical protein
MLYPVAGTRLFIGGALDVQSDDFVLADFDGQTWTEIKNLDSIGTFGDTSQGITRSIVGESRDKTLKGTRNAGTFEVVANLDLTDAGQLALIAAEKTDDNYAVKIVANDAPAGGTPSERYFIGLVLSAAEGRGGANDVVVLNGSIAINSNIVRKDATGSGTVPSNSALPAITGTAEVGETLTASHGTWSGTTPLAYAYQWFADGESIPGANGTTYVPVSGDIGKAITVLVTATNVKGQASAMSAATSDVAEAS